MRKLLFFSFILAACNTQHTDTLNTGIALYNQNKFDSAQIYFLSVLDKDSANGKAHEYAGICYRRQQNFNEAALHLEKALQLGQNNFDLFYTLGEIDFAKANYTTALNNFLIAYRLDSTRAKINYNLGITYWRGFEALDKAQYYVSRQIALEPDDPENYAMRAQLFLQRDQYDECMANFSKAIELSPDSGKYYALRGYAWFAAGKYDKGLADLSKTLQLDSLDQDVRVWRGKAYYDQGNKQAACNDFSFAKAHAQANDTNHLEELLAKACR